MDRLPYRPSSRNMLPLRVIEEVYEPLDSGEIRLLHLEGFDEHGVLLCSLQPTILEEAEDQYTAISYTWNEKENVWYGKKDISRKVILLNGLAISVSNKVAHIMAFMTATGRQKIWIDAVCINQSDLIEKSQQVRMMGDIYIKAVEVVSVLGSPHSTVDCLLDAVNSFSLDPSKDPYKHGGKADKTIAGMFRVFFNAYWHRAWILQELMLAKNVVLFCGSKSTSFKNYQKWLQPALTGSRPEMGVAALRATPELIKILPKLWRQTKDHGFNSLPRSDVDNSFNMASSQPFIEVLTNGKRFASCRDPRDVLYSRLALAADADVLIPSVNYQESVEKVFEEFAARQVLSTRRLDLLLFIDNNTMNLPSWVPDWTSCFFDTGAAGYDREVGKQLEAVPWSYTALPSVSNDGKRLTVQGRHLCTVARRSSVMTLLSLLFGAVDLGGSRKTFSLSENVRSGDVVCILKDCHAAVHLQPIKDRFKLVGRNYFNYLLIKLPGHWSSPSYWKPCNLLLSTVSRRYAQGKERMDIEAISSIPEQIFTII